MTQWSLVSNFAKNPYWRRRVTIARRLANHSSSALLTRDGSPGPHTVITVNRRTVFTGDRRRRDGRRDYGAAAVRTVQ